MKTVQEESPQGPTKYLLSKFRINPPVRLLVTTYTLVVRDEIHYCKIVLIVEFHIKNEI